MSCYRRANKTPGGFDKRAKMSDAMKWDSEEDSPAGKTPLLFLLR